MLVCWNQELLGHEFTWSLYMDSCLILFETRILSPSFSAEAGFSFCTWKTISAKMLGICSWGCMEWMVWLFLPSLVLALWMRWCTGHVALWAKKNWLFWRPPKELRLPAGCMELVKLCSYFWTYFCLLSVAHFVEQIVQLCIFSQVRRSWLTKIKHNCAESTCYHFGLGVMC